MYWDSAAQRTGCTKKRIRVEYVPIGQDRGGQCGGWEFERRFQSRGLNTSLLSLP